MGGGFTWLSKDIEKDKALAREGWERCKQALSSSDYQLVVLDEITYPVTYGWLPVEEVIEALKQRPPQQHVILTGRQAHEQLVEYADLVTEDAGDQAPLQSWDQSTTGVRLLAIRLAILQGGAP